MCTGLTLALDFQVSSLCQRSVVIIIILMNAKAGCAEMCLKYNFIVN